MDLEGCEACPEEHLDDCVPPLGEIDWVANAGGQHECSSPADAEHLQSHDGHSCQDWGDQACEDWPEERRVYEPPSDAERIPETPRDVPTGRTLTDGLREPSCGECQDWSPDACDNWFRAR